LLPSDPSGLTLQYGIFVRGDCRQDRHLVVHELVHTAQYERLGGILRFLRDYLFECATLGYGEAPLEQEAVEVAARICGLGSARASRAAAGALASGSSALNHEWWDLEEVFGEGAEHGTRGACAPAGRLCTSRPQAYGSHRSTPAFAGLRLGKQIYTD
jgi:hypothetical protein